MTAIATFPSRGLLALALVLVQTLAGLATPVVAQFGGFGSDQHAEATLYLRPEGDLVRAAVTFEIDDGWHLYHDDLGHPDAIGTPTTFAFEGEGVAWGAPRFPEPHPLDQSDIAGPGAFINAHEGSIVVYVLGEGVPAGEVSLTIDGLTCEDNGSCVIYSETITSSGEGSDALFEAFPADLSTDPESAGGAAAATTEAPALDPDRWTDEALAAVTFGDYEPRSDAPTHGLAMWLLLAFVAGMILNVMPCVLPVISIKVLSFVQQAGEDKGRILALGLAFAAGIVVVFLVLATLAATAGLGWGQQFQSQEFLVVMIGLVFAFALSLFGVYELGVPAGVGGLAGGPPREGLGDAFFKGMLATVLATPCSGPFLGSTLTWTLSQPVLVIYAVFLALGLGMALPYVVLTANPGLLKVVPRPGPWMDTFKQAMGFVLMATVVYLMISVRQDMLLFTAAFLLMVGVACWVWGRYGPRASSKPGRLAVLAVALGVAALGGRVAFVDFRGLFHSEEEGGLEWVTFDPEVFQSATASGRSVFVDFTAAWCPNCKYNEKFVYESEAVRALLDERDVLALKADITHSGPYTDMVERLLDELGAVSIPFMAVFSGDAPREPHVRYDIVTVDDVTAILSSLPVPGP